MGSTRILSETRKREVRDVLTTANSYRLERRFGHLVENLKHRHLPAMISCQQFRYYFISRRATGLTYAKNLERSVDCCCLGERRPSGPAAIQPTLQRGNGVVRLSNSTRR
jgi:hypothetical protein